MKERKKEKRKQEKRKKRRKEKRREEKRREEKRREEKEKSKKFSIKTNCYIIELSFKQYLYTLLNYSTVVGNTKH